MTKPTPTLEDVRKVMDEQDRQLEAAHRALIHLNGDQPISLPAAAMDHLDAACEVRLRPSGALKPISGIRC